MRRASAGTTLALILQAAFALAAAARDIAPARAEVSGTDSANAKQSTPDFPKEVNAPPGAPNVLLIMTDDVGFGGRVRLADRCPRPPWTGSPAAAFAIINFTPRPCARPPGRPC